VFVCILPEKAIPEMTYTVSSGTLNPTHSLTRYPCISIVMHVLRGPIFTVLLNRQYWTSLFGEPFILPYFYYMYWLILPYINKIILINIMK